MKASLVSARNEDELRIILAEVADAPDARWTEYKGPLWLDVELPVVPSGAVEGSLDAAAIVAAREVPLAVRFGETEAGQAMREVIARWTVPHTQAVVDALADACDDRDPDEAAFDGDAPCQQQWRERVASAGKADEAEMTVYAHQRREREAELRDPVRRFAREELRAAIDRIAASLVGGKAHARPSLTLVRGNDED